MKLLLRSILFLTAASSLFSLSTPLRAVGIVIGVDGSGNNIYNYNIGDPTSAQIPNWNTGWGAANLTGWDYFGVRGASGVYLGNGWVLTAGHVGFGNFTFVSSGVTYTAIAGSGINLKDVGGTGYADMYMFEIADPPSLPALNLALNPPVAASPTQAGDSVVMFGNGGARDSWGVNVVSEINVGPLDLAGEQAEHGTPSIFSPLKAPSTIMERLSIILHN